MKVFWVSILALALFGCGVNPGKINAGQIKQKQQKQLNAEGNSVKDATGVDLGTAAPAPRKKFRLPTAPVDP